MKSVVKHKILPEHRLIIEVLGGEIDFKDVINLKMNQVTDSLYNKKYNFILVIRKSNILLDEEELHKFIEFVKSNASIADKRKSAILTDTPEQVVQGIIYQSESKELPMDFNVVSTVESALSWVGINPEFSPEIETVISELEEG